MTIKTILVGASGGSATNGAVELACQLAVRFGAHLEAYHVKFDPNEVIAAVSGAGAVMPTDSGWIGQMVQDADDLAAKTKAAFYEVTRQRGLVPAGLPHVGPSIGWREDTGRAAARVAARARFFDLVVLGRSDRVVDLPTSDAIEETLMVSGRPVLLAPAAVPASIGHTVAVGWDGSTPAVRAMVAALPLLEKARRIVILTVGDKPDADPSAACDYLAWHGVASICQTVQPVPRVGRGELLLSAAREAGADLLAMGAFGHAPWREMLFGGATRTIVGNSLLPVLLTH